MAGSVVDLFSGGGGASYGFHVHPGFQVVGAADAQLGKPSSGRGTLDCNATYRLNMGFHPSADLGSIDPSVLAEKLGITQSPTVLIACPPCTGFSRTLAKNHLEDDHRNTLVGRTADFVAELKPEVLIMENARELIMGRFNVHLGSLVEILQGRLGYDVKPEIHFLNRFGLPQKRERAVLVAVKRGLPLRTLDDLWAGFAVDPKATCVRRAIWDLPPLEAGHASEADPMHVAPAIGD